MPRRIPDFPDSFHSWNFLSSIGSGITLLSFALFCRPVLRDLIDRPIEIKIEKPSITPIISFSPAGSRDREEIV
jgi:heme/copper-type cytochrome/quinol oxidase subunit 1